MFGFLIRSVAQVRSVVAERSQPPIAYVFSTSDISKVSVLLISSKDSQEAALFSLILKSLQSTPGRSAALFFALSTN